MASFLGKCLLCMQCTCSNSEDDEHSTLVERVIPFYTLKARPGSQPRTTSASARTDIHPTCLAPSALVPEKGLAWTRSQVVSAKDKAARLFLAAKLGCRTANPCQQMAAWPWHSFCLSICCRTTWYMDRLRRDQIDFTCRVAISIVNLVEVGPIRYSALRSRGGDWIRVGGQVTTNLRCKHSSSTMNSQRELRIDNETRSSLSITLYVLIVVISLSLSRCRSGYKTRFFPSSNSHPLIRHNSETPRWI